MAEIFDPNAAPDFNAQTADVARQQKLAAYLRKQMEAMPDTPQAQMVGGRWIAPSAANSVVKAFGGYEASRADAQAAAAERQALEAQRAHADQWRANMPQEVEGRAAIPENYVMQSPEDQAGVPGVQAQPMTLDRVLRHTLAAGNNPALARDAELFSKYNVANIESKQKQQEARELKEATIASQEKLAREKREDEAKYRLTTDQRIAENDKKLANTLAVIAAKGSGGGGSGGMGGQAMVIGADEAQNPIYRHTKSGALFQYNEIGAPVPYKGAVGAKPEPNKPLTEAQGNAVLYGTRAAQAHNVLDSVGTNYSPVAVAAGRATDGTPLIGMGVNAALPENEQKVLQAQRNFINAILRKESGAAIQPSEFDNARLQYFPQPGDSPGVLAQKKANRELAIKGLGEIAGPKGAKSVAAERANVAPPTVVREVKLKDGRTGVEYSDGTRGYK